MRPLRIACFTGLVLALVMACLVVAVAGGQAPGGGRGGEDPFVGRWEILMQFPPEVNPFEDVGAPFIIIDIAGRGTSLSGKLVASMSEAGVVIKLVEVSVKDNHVLCILLEAEGIEAGGPVPVTLQFKLVDDHLEGTLVGREGAKEMAMLFATTSVGRRTTRDTVVPPTRRPPSADQQAFSSAMGREPAERTEVLKQFLKDYPDFRQKQLAILSLAMSYQNAVERRAALRAFVAEFPKSPLKDYAQAEIANAEKAMKAGVRKK